MENREKPQKYYSFYQYVLCDVCNFTKAEQSAALGEMKVYLKET